MLKLKKTQTWTCKSLSFSWIKIINKYVIFFLLKMLIFNYSNNKNNFNEQLVYDNYYVIYYNLN